MYFYLSQKQILNSYWTRLSKISWFTSKKQSVLWDTDRSEYFLKTEFNILFHHLTTEFVLHNYLSEAGSVTALLKQTQEKHNFAFNIIIQAGLHLILFLSDIIAEIHHGEFSPPSFVFSLLLFFVWFCTNQIKPLSHISGKRAAVFHRH